MGTDKRIDWDSLDHDQKMEELRRRSNDQLCGDYRWIDHSDEAFKQRLTQDRNFWTPNNYSELQKRGDPPKKSLFMGAFRDLDRAEALLELIDNSIDAWTLRRTRYPKKTAKELDIYIDIDAERGQLVYEDNAGGVSKDNLDNLVIPGFSETTERSRTIGSYRTGGKKAVFRLARNARIDTRYWNPAGGETSAYTIHIPRDWMLDDTTYKYSYSRQAKSDIEEGQTRYTFQLHEEPAGDPWFQKPLTTIVREMKLAYSLHMIRNPKINIHFCDRQKALPPDEDLFLFSGAHDEATGLDLRAQSETFEMQIDYQGTKYEIEIEIVLGCRTTTGTPELAGIDFYGNDRLFIGHDKEILTALMPGGAARNLVRGYVNFKGPNILIPWDTHKRHLNADAQIMSVLLNHPAIRQVFQNWHDVYQDVARQKGIKARISQPQRGVIGKGDIILPHVNKTRIRDPERRRRSRKYHLPKMHAPTVPQAKRSPKRVRVTIDFTEADARTLYSHYGLDGRSPKALGDSIKADVLSKAGKGRRRVDRNP